MIKAFAIGASLVTLAAAVPANAALFVLDDNGGTGSVVETADGFILTGSAGDTGNFISTTYTTVVRSARTITFRYSYSTLDDESIFDPAGYLINGVPLQLSPSDLPFGDIVSGFVRVNVAANTNFGFYVDSIDDQFGPGQLEISQLGIPEPATWAFMIVGFGFIGGAMRAAKRTTKVSFA